MGDFVTYEVRGQVAIITLNRPDARNAVNGDLAADMESVLDRFENEDGVWVGVLTANTTGHKSPVFCAGADLKALNSGAGAGLSTKRGGFAGYVYRDRKKPIVVAVDGLATAGGCEIVLASDLVIASTRSSFGLAEVKRNLIAAAGVDQRDVGVLQRLDLAGRHADMGGRPHVGLAAVVEREQQVDGLVTARIGRPSFVGLQH